MNSGEKMRILKAFLIVLLCFAALLGAALAGLNIALNSSKVRRQIERAATASTGRKITIGTISFNIFRGLEIRRIEIRESDAQTVFARTEKIYLSYDLKSLLKKEIRIDRISVVRPYIRIIVKEDGSFNYSDLASLAGEKTGKTVNERQALPAFGLALGYLNLEDGIVDLVNEKDKFSLTVEKINTRSSGFDIYKGGTLEVSGYIGDMRLEARGNVDAASMKGAFDVNVSDIMLSKLPEIYPPAPRMEGMLDIKAKVSAEGPAGFSGSAECTVKGLVMDTFTFSGTVTVPFMFDGKALTIESGVIDSAVTASFGIVFNTADSTGKFTLTSKGDLKNVSKLLPALMPFTGNYEISMSADILNAGSDIKGTIDLFSGNTGIKGTGESLTLGIPFSKTGDKFEIKKGTFKIGKNTAFIDLVSDLKNKKANGKIYSDLIDVLYISGFAASMMPGGGMSNPAAGKNAAPALPAEMPYEVDLFVEVQKGTIGNAEVRNFFAELNSVKTGITMKPMRFDIYGGSFNGDMTLDLADQSFVSAFEIKGINTDPLLGALKNGLSGFLFTEISGSGYIRGRTDAMALEKGEIKFSSGKGYIKNKEIIASLMDLINGRSKDTVSFDSMSGTAEIKDNKIEIRDTGISSELGKLSPSGTIGFEGALDMSIKAEGPIGKYPFLEKYSRYLSKGGDISFGVIISGTLKTPLIKPDISEIEKTAKEKAKEDIKSEGNKLLKKGLELLK